MKAKIQLPRKPKGLLYRPRLVNFLHENVDRKLVVISAAAGYGKTCLLLDYAYEAEIPVCWYSLDQFDRDPRVLLEHFIASIRLRFPSFGEKSLAVLRNLRDLSEEMYPLVSTLANEIYDDIPEYFTIILDDYHFVDESDLISDFMGYLLQYTDEHCHLIVSSRTLPGIPNQALLSARNQMAGLSTDELRFTAEEIQALIKQNYDLDMPADKAEELALHSEGWITSILLTTQTMWGKLIEGVIEARGTGGGVYDFLAEQVFAQQPPELRRFLLGTSVLEELNPELCDTLLEIDGSEGMLGLALKRNLFLVELEGEGRWFRYHHLFQEFLQDRLRREDKGRYGELHLKAAGTYEHKRQWDRAVDHYLKLGLYQEVARVVETAGREMFDVGRLEALASWIDALPEEVLRSRGQLLLLRGMVYLERGNYVLAMRLWEEAQQEFSSSGDKTNMARTLERKGTALRFQGKFQEATALCREALALTDGSGEEKAAPADAYRTIGICYHRLGRLGQAIEHLERSLQLYEQTERQARIASLHHHLGVVYSEAGQLAEAAAHFQAALRCWEKIGNPEPWAHTLNSIGMNHYFRGEYDRALRFFNKALAKAREGGNPRTQAFVLASLADLYRDSEDYDRALQMYSEALEAADQVGEGWAITYVQNARGETYRLMGA
ncbi:MAG: tetratricopeptide repeat protein, partial [Anaerolineae bacterium]